MGASRVHGPFSACQPPPPRQPWQPQPPATAAAGRSQAKERTVEGAAFECDVKGLVQEASGSVRSAAGCVACVRADVNGWRGSGAGGTSWHERIFGCGIVPHAPHRRGEGGGRTCSSTSARISALCWAALSARPTRVARGQPGRPACENAAAAHACSPGRSEH